MKEPTLIVWSVVLVVVVLQLVLVSTSSGVHAGFAAALQLLGAIVNRALVTPAL